jgi:hypothetical protein
LGGSGQVGGALLLQNRSAVFSPRPNFSFDASIGVGSFGNVPASLATSVSTRKFALKLRGMGVKAKNDYPFTDAQGSSQKMPNASSKGWGLLADASWKVSTKDLLSLHAWQQAFDREIPPALFESYSFKEQHDESTRLMLEWKHAGLHLNHYSRFAFLRDVYRYRDSIVHLDNTSRNTTFLW